MSILTELSHIQEIVHSLCLLSSDPESLPESTEHLIDDMLSDGKTRHQLKQVISTVFFAVDFIPFKVGFHHPSSWAEFTGRCTRASGFHYPS